MACSRSLLKDTAGDFSGPCARPGGLKELHKIHRTLPAVPVPDKDQDVLQDEDGFAVLDEQTAGFIFDDLR